MPLLSRAILAAVLSLLLLPPAASAMTFAVIGDFGMGGWSTWWWPEIRSANALNYVCAKLRCNFTISCGDNIYIGNVLQGIEESFEKLIRVPAPLFPSIGNHDNVGPQVEYTKRGKRWKFPGAYYTYEMPIDQTGYTVAIFAVNTMDGGLAGGPQYVWLEEALKKSKARWKFIFGHHPTVGSGRHKRIGSVGRIHELMTKYNAQAFFAGHDHIVEMSNLHGRVLGISGGMARGGMMIRGIGGAIRRFTLTHPSDYNKFVQDWPTHGFLTVRLTPTVMNVQVWDQYRAIQYDFSVPHDWMSNISQQPQAQQHEWPAPDIINRAYRSYDPTVSGNGTGVLFMPDGAVARFDAAAIRAGNVTPDIIETAAPGAVASTYAPLPRAEQVVDKNSDATMAGGTPEGVGTNPFLRYSISTECVPCGGRPSIGHPFTVFIIGADVTSKSRLYITSSPVGCEQKNRPELLPGTTIVAPASNTIVFNVTAGPATAAYLCYSQDRGNSYAPLVLFNSDFGESSFVIASNFTEEEKDAIHNGTMTDLNENNSADDLNSNDRSSPSAPINGEKAGNKRNEGGEPPAAGHSTATLLLVSVVSIMASAVGALFIIRMQQAGSYDLVPQEREENNGESSNVDLETRQGDRKKTEIVMKNIPAKVK